MLPSLRVCTAVPGALPLPDGLPAEAHPQQPRKGRLSYTIKSATGARVEVLLNTGAFKVKDAAGGPAERGAYIAWSAHASVAAAWDWLKQYAIKW